MMRMTMLPALVLSLLGGCESDDLQGPELPVVDQQSILVPPADFPLSDAARVTVVGNGTSTLTRTADGATARLVLGDQTPGHVLVYATITFNHPEYCVQGEDRLPRAGPCRGNGPTDQRDGAIPEVEISADAWSSVVVGATGSVEFDVDFTHDTPVQRVNGGPGVANPMGAVVFAYVMDKGPLVDEGPLRGAQLNSLYGGCQGPPAMGPLPCRGAAIVQHLPG